MKGPLTWESAGAIGSLLIEDFGPTMERSEIVGSVRRRKADCKDVEILFEPAYVVGKEPGALWDIDVEVNTQFVLAEGMRNTGQVSDRLDVNGRGCFGPAFQRIVYRDFAVDLFGVMPGQSWAVHEVIRTGNKDFSRLVVTVQSCGGYLPDDLTVKGWNLCERESGNIIETPTERDFFAAIGKKYLEPWERNP